jgi:methionyl-tRNA formyltransferase
MKLIFMGTPDFAALVLGRLSASDHQILAVYTRPDRAAGRHLQPATSPVKEVALKLGISVVQPASLRQPQEIMRLAGFAPEIIVVAAYGLLLPSEVLRVPPLGCLNLHPSLLPRYRGAAPVAAAILAGDLVTGVSVMLLDEGMDTGPILAQVEQPVSRDDTTGSLTTRLAQRGAELLLETLVPWAEGKLKPRPQGNEGVSYARLISKQDGEINWGRSAEELGRQVRACQPWPGCFTRWRGRLLRIVQAEPLPAEPGVKTGQVVALHLAGSGVEVAVGTGQGLLGLVLVQLEGRRVMTAAEFVRGQRDFVGERLDA